MTQLTLLVLLRQHIFFALGRQIGNKIKTLARDKLRSKGRKVNDLGTTIQAILDGISSNMDTTENLTGAGEFLN